MTVQRPLPPSPSSRLACCLKPAHSRGLLQCQISFFALGVEKPEHCVAQAKLAWCHFCHVTGAGVAPVM